MNHGGSELVVYRVTPPDAQSGVRVGNYEYPGYPATGAGIASSDPALRVAFFALLWDQDPKNTPIRVYARDSVGNESSGSFDYRVFPKQFRSSRIELDDAFLAKVVPPIVQNSPELKVDDPSDLLASYLKINRDLRKMNNDTITKLAAQTSPEILWRGAFKQLTNTAVEAGFADQRTYLYKGKEVDRQVHLGFDLASLAGAPVKAANRGRVLHAGWLGIYGNCVIIDHGMGLMSLYAHLSSIEAQVGDLVELDKEIGRSGSTGLAGGDHLHFTMLLAGNAITPIDWWSAQWVQDRVTRKLNDAGAPATSAHPRRRRRADQALSKNLRGTTTVARIPESFTISSDSAELAEPMLDAPQPEAAALERVLQLRVGLQPDTVVGDRDRDLIVAAQTAGQLDDRRSRMLADVGE